MLQDVAPPSPLDAAALSGLSLLEEKSCGLAEKISSAFAEGDANARPGAISLREMLNAL